MPKALDYTDGELCQLAEILIEKKRRKIRSLKKSLKICDDGLADGIHEEIKNVRALLKTITPASKALKGDGKESAKQKKRDYILDDFNKSYPVGGKSRDRITARIRSSRRRKDADKPLINTFDQSTKKALAQLRGFKEFDKNLSLKQIVLELIVQYKAAQAKKVAEKRNNN
jgi:hypothetical protein